MGSNSRARGRIGTLAVAALTFGGLVAAAPASAADATGSTLRWGFRQSFRSYVGNPGNTAPEPIAPQSPTAFDGAGDSITRPYAFPVAGGVVVDVDNFGVALAGGVTYSYPAHTFTIDLSDVVVVVSEGEALVVADVRVDTTGPGFEPVAENDVLIATSSAVDAALTPTALDVVITDLELSEEGSEALQGFLRAGAELDDMKLDVALDEGEIPWTPYLSVLSNVVGTESTDIVVRGYGFEYGAMRSTHLGNRVVGPYVALGTVVDPWQPSLGGTSENRKNVSVIWAVEEALLADPRVGGAGGVLFEEDGSFAGTLSGAASDFDGAPGRAAIYSYTTAPAIAAWEIETAVELEAAVEPPVDVPLVTTQPRSASVTVGSTVTFTAVATGADSLQWQSRAGSGPWVDVAGATSATLEVATTSVSQTGTQYRVVATNAGDTVESAAATLTVTKADATVAVSVKKKVRFASKPTATVTVDAPEGVAATGAVVVKAGSKVVGKGTLRDGAATVTLTKKLRPGTRNLVAEYAGNADLTTAMSNAAKVKVKKAAAKAKAKLAKKKVKVGKRGVLRVKVTAKGVKPSGKVKVTITKGKKKVRVVTLRAKGGKYVKVRLPRLAKGTYQVRARYTGSKTVTKKSTKKVTLRVR